MVLAAPIFLVTQTANFRAYYARNREPILRITYGVVIAWLSLRLLSKHYECRQLADDLESVTREKASFEASISRVEWVQSTVASICKAGVGSLGSEALVGALAKARSDSDRSVREVLNARVGSKLETLLGPNLPKSGVLEDGRRRAAEAADEARSAVAGASPAGKLEGPVALPGKVDSTPLQPPTSTRRLL